MADWFKVRPDDDLTVLDACAQCFRNVSEGNTTLTGAQLKTRLEQKRNERAPGPVFMDGTGDNETLMFRLFRYSKDIDSLPLLTVALDRTLYREAFLNQPIGRARRNHWCITLGFSEDNDLELNDTKDALLALLKPTGTYIPVNYQLALLWKARESSSIRELKDPPEWENLKHRSDAIFIHLHFSKDIGYVWHNPEDAPSEVSYAHWREHLGPATHIRFVPIKVNP